MQTVYIFLNVLSLIIVSILGILSYKNKDEKCAKYFMYSMLFMGIWTLGTIFELYTKNFYLKVLFRNVIQFGMAFVSVANYWFVIVYTDFYNKRHKIILQVFIILNVIAMILLFTDPIHHLLRSEVYMIESNSAFDLIVKSTYLGDFFVLIRFVLFGFATVLLFVYLAKTFRNMRKQVVMISLGFLLSLVMLVAKQYWFEDLGFSVPMSVILCIPYIFINIGVFKYNFLSISPLAKDWVINSLEEGIVVLSKEGKLMESNTAASLFFEEVGSLIAKDTLKSIYNSVEDSVDQFQFDTLTGSNYYEIKIHHLLMANGKKRGSVAVIRNVTNQMVRHFELKEKAEFDGLTQIFNRQTLEREYSKLNHGTISIIVLDIDRFKGINDTFGHPVGDAVIVGIANAMKKCIRNNDLIGRIGGDEFCIILAECSTELCQSICNRLIERVKSQHYEVTCKLPTIEVSIGAFTHFEVGSLAFKEAYEKADLMLYQAKKEGGNCAIIQ